MSRILFNTDCEGPTVANDHAAEVADNWLPDGMRLFKQLSQFDDFVAYVRQRPFYNSGDTLRLILPFLKSVGVTNEALETWTKAPNRIQWIEGAQEAIGHLVRDENVEVFEISASYYPFAAQVAEKLGIAPDRVYSTYYSLDRYKMNDWEASRLDELATEIVMLPDVPSTYPGETTLEDFPEDEMAALTRLEEIVWGEMAEELPCSRRMLQEIRAMGGSEKVNAIHDSLKRTQLNPEKMIYVGDSITDVESFKELNDMGGISVSFNGNQHAVDSATFSSWGDTSLISAVIAGIVRDKGVDGLREFAEHHDPKLVPRDLEDIFGELSQHKWGVSVRTNDNRDAILRDSDKFRKLTRKAAAAALT